MIKMMESQNTQEWVERAKAGDRAAFDSIVNRYAGRLEDAVRARLQSRNRPDVEVDDVLQETFVRAFEAIGRFAWRGEDSFYPWLYGISRNVILKFCAKQSKMQSFELSERAATDDVAPSKAARRDERFDRLERCLSKLKPEYREVLRLARLDGLSIRRIAERMQRSEASVKHLVARALKQLRESFGDTESIHLPPRSLEAEWGAHGKE